MRFRVPAPTLGAALRLLEPTGMRVNRYEVELHPDGTCTCKGDATPEQRAAAERLGVQFLEA